MPALSLRDTASPAVRPLLDAFPQPNGAELPAAATGLAGLTREFPVESKLSAFSLRVDGNLTDRHRLFTRINRGTSGGDELDTLQQPRVVVRSQGSGRDEHGDRWHHVGLLFRHARSARQREHP